MAANTLKSWIFACGTILAFLTVITVSAKPTHRLRIYTVNYPLAYFAQRIGGDLVEVVLPVPPAVDPAFWVPDATSIGAYQQANLILLNGAGYAGWLNRATLPRTRMFDTSSRFSTDYLPVEGTVSHQHGPGGDHLHAGTAFTTWLDFQQAIAQAESVWDALREHLPAEHATLQANFRRLREDLGGLHAAFRDVSASLQEIPLMASHPVYQYLARRYGLAIKSVLWEPDIMPTPRQWQQLEQRLATRPSHLMLWEAPPLPEITERLAEVGITVVVVDPGANRPSRGDFLDIMRTNLAALQAITVARSP